MDKETKGIQTPFLNTTLPKPILYFGSFIVFKTWVEYFSNNMKVVAVSISNRYQVEFKNHQESCPVL